MHVAALVFEIFEKVVLELCLIKFLRRGSPLSLIIFLLQIYVYSVFTYYYHEYIVYYKICFMFHLI